VSAPQLSIFAPRVAAPPVLTRPSVGAVRPYQTTRIEQARANLAEHRSTLIVMATGTGKTRVFGQIAWRWPGRVLVLAHRKELIEQARDRLAELTGERIGVERAGSRSHGQRIVVASKDSLHPVRLAETFKPDDFKLIIVDEAHHAVAKTYTSITSYFPDAKLLGVTATPDRADQKALGRVFDSVCEPYDILDGIRDEFLCPLVGKLERLPSFDLSGLKANGPGGDYGDGQLGAELARNDATLKAICLKTIEHAGDRRSILFFPTVETAHLAAEALNVFRPGCARSVDGETPEDARDMLFRDYRAGVFQVLTNCGVATEGFDCPPIALVGVARPTKSRSLYAQMVGRGTRIFPGKTDCLVVDFVGASDVHGLVTPEDLLGGLYDDDEIAEAKKIAKDGGRADKNLEEARRRVQARKLEAQRVAAARAAHTTGGTFDPFKVLGMGQPQTWAAHYAAPPTENQIATLTKAQIPIPEDLTKAQASAIIGKLRKRWDDGLATLPMVKLLSKFGIPAANMPIDNAKAVIGWMDKDGKERRGRWRRPPADVLASLMQREPGIEG